MFVFTQNTHQAGKVHPRIPLLLSIWELWLGANVSEHSFFGQEVGLSQNSCVIKFQSREIKLDIDVTLTYQNVGPF